MPPPRVLPALVTPFTRRGELDLEAHRHNLHLLASQGVAGFLVAGSTGEGPYLEPGEREALVTTARAELGKGTFLMCGVAAETRRVAEEQVAEASRGGADAVLVLTPTTLVRNRHQAVVRFYKDLAGRAPLPVFLYSVPPVTAYELPESAVAELASHPNIAGMKDSGGNAVRLGRVVTATPGDFLLFNGSTPAICLAVGAGAFGAITASTNYAAELITELVNRARRSVAAARPLQAPLTALAAAVESHGIPGTKAAAAAAGLQPGYPRAPLRALPAARARRLARLVQEAAAVA